MHIIPIKNIPLINPGDDLAAIIIRAFQDNGVSLRKNDIVAITSKIVSKADGRMVNLSQIEPSSEAVDLAEKTAKDPRFVELVLRESRSVLRYKPGALVVEHRCGFVCANAGIDHSNVNVQDGNPEDWVLLLPANPDQSAREIRTRLERHYGVEIGVAIIDSHGRAWRMGTVGTAIGISGVPGLVDMRGMKDISGYHLRITEVGIADELAAAASLVMGQAAERIPVVLVRDFPYQLRESSAQELLRPRDQDMFR
ncbi:MAG: coenzyme F420-0:L-glutamate ligase [Anaerolineae bacterium]|nr:coenzyme F420-0:L-glutamate ligase [Anaerolineae bacterium]